MSDQQDNLKYIGMCFYDYWTDSYLYFKQKTEYKSSVLRNGGIIPIEPKTIKIEHEKINIDDKQVKEIVRDALYEMNGWKYMSQEEVRFRLMTSRSRN